MMLMSPPLGQSSRLLVCEAGKLTRGIIRRVCPCSKDIIILLILGSEDDIPLLLVASSIEYGGSHNLPAFAHPRDAIENAVAFSRFISNL